jgi:uncharacterized membrane protein YeiH
VSEAWAWLYLLSPVRRKRRAAGLNTVMAAPMGMLTGIGGEVLRYVLVNETPTVLRADLHAVAALAAGIAVVISRSS